MMRVTYDQPVARNAFKLKEIDQQKLFGVSQRIRDSHFVEVQRPVGVVVGVDLPCAFRPRTRRLRHVKEPAFFLSQHPVKFL
jgi:hypothetical protein